MNTTGWPTPRSLLRGPRRTGDQSLLHETLTYLQGQQRIAAAGNLGWYVIKLHLLQALTHHALGESEQALTTLITALHLAEPEGYMRIFVDEGEALRLLIVDCRLRIVEARQRSYLDRVLAAFDEAASPKHAHAAAATSQPIRNLQSPLSILLNP